MLVGYARVSTDLQTTDGQIDALKAAGCERVFEEPCLAPVRIARSSLPRWSSPARGTCGVVRLDRLARSMRQFLTTVDTLAARGIGLRSLHQTIDTTTATGRLVLHIFAALGQFEVELLRERTRRLGGQPRPWSIGGRPPALDAIKVRAAKAMWLGQSDCRRNRPTSRVCAPTLYRHVPGGRTAVDESGVSAAI